MFDNFHFTLWYSVAISSLVAFLALRWISYSVSRFLAIWSIYIVTKHLRYTAFIKSNESFITIGDILVYILLLIANIICSSWRVNSINNLSLRIASLLLTNLTLLLPSPDIVADIFRISIYTYQKLHIFLASIAVIQSILHSSIEVYKKGLIWNIETATGIIAFLSIIVVALTSIKPFRKRAHEVFRLIHITASALTSIILWFHIFKRNRQVDIQLIVNTSVWAVSLLYRYSLLLYRNFAWNTKRTTAIVEITGDALKLQISPARPWKVRPGQYIYLTIANAGTLSRFQRHPFMVASPILTNSIELHVWPQKGFTERLLRLSSEIYHTYDAWIEGPYGYTTDLREFGTVILIASGIGITGHLSYLRDLVENQDYFDTKTRDVIFIWYMESGFRHHPAQEFMDELLKKDKEGIQDRLQTKRLTKQERSIRSTRVREYPGNRPVPSGSNVLDIYIYREDSPLNQKRSGTRLVEIRGKPDYSTIIGDIMNSRSGNIAISVCATNTITNEVRAKVSKVMNRNVKLVISNFEPFSATKQPENRRSMSFTCQGID